VFDRVGYARVAELADAQDSGSCGSRSRGGSSPPSRTFPSRPEARLQPALRQHSSLRRRQLRLVGLVALSLLIVAFVWRVCTAGPSATADYVDRVRPIIQESNKVGSDLSSIATELPTFTREVLDERVASTQSRANALVEKALKEKAKDEAKDLEALFLASLKLRAVGINNFARGVANALEGVPAQQVTAELENAVQLMSSGDRAYEVFASEARSRLAERKETKVEVPDSRFVKDSPYTGDQLPKFVKALQSQPRLAPIHNVAIAQITTKPAATSKLANSLDLLPASSSFVLIVTISNDGNLPEKNIAVKVRLTSEVRPDPQERQEVIATLDPGAKKSITFSDLEPSRNQAKNTVSVFVDPVTDEKNVDDNRKDYSFAMK
jgi:hypothetical protein